MKKTIFFICILCFLLLYSDIATLIGFGNMKLTISVVPLTAFLLYEALNNKIIFSYRVVPEICLIVMGVIIIIVEYLIGQNFVRRILLFLFLPYVLSIYLFPSRRKYQKPLRYAIYVVLLIQIAVIIYERLMNSVLLSSEEQYYIYNMYGDAWSFKACGIYGHPLTGAMILSVTNIFVLVSNLKIRVKLLIFISIMVGLLCLNERGNIVITSLSSIPFVYRYLSKQEISKRILMSFFVILLFFFIFQGLSDSSFGGRLFHHKEGFQDVSSAARLEAYSAFDYLNKNILLWGFGDEKITLINLTYAENGYITILLIYGVVLGAPLLLFLLYYIYKRLYIYRWQDALLIAFVFGGIGLTNPQLANPLQWFYFIINLYAFGPIKGNSKIYIGSRFSSYLTDRNVKKRLFVHK